MMKVCSIHLSGAVGYWLCTMLLSGSLVWLGTSGSAINLALITIERYLKMQPSSCTVVLAIVLTV